MSPARAPKSGQHYTDAEVALVYLIEGSKEADELLARLLGRTEGAINIMRRWADGAHFPPKAFNKIKQQFAWMEEHFGEENRHKIKLP
jgi:hypothetical protein